MDMRLMRRRRGKIPNSQAKGLIIGQFPGERMRTDEDQSFR